MAAAPRDKSCASSHMKDGSDDSDDDDDYWDQMAGGGPDPEPDPLPAPRPAVKPVSYESEDGWLDAMQHAADNCDEDASLSVLGEEARLWRQLALETGPAELKWPVPGGTVMRLSTDSHRDCLTEWLAEHHLAACGLKIMLKQYCCPAIQEVAVQQPAPGSPPSNLQQHEMSVDDLPGPCEGYGKLSSKEGKGEEGKGEGEEEEGEVEEWYVYIDDVTKEPVAILQKKQQRDGLRPKFRAFAVEESALRSLLSSRALDLASASTVMVAALPAHYLSTFHRAVGESPSLANQAVWTEPCGLYALVDSDDDEQDVSDCDAGGGGRVEGIGIKGMPPVGSPRRREETAGNGMLSSGGGGGVRNGPTLKRGRSIADNSITTALHDGAADTAALPSTDIDGSFVCRLTAADAVQVNAAWTYKSDTSLAMVKQLIQSRPAYGLRLASSDPEVSDGMDGAPVEGGPCPGELVCWCLTYDDGAWGMLHSVETHRGKGYAKRVMQHMITQHLADSGTTTCTQSLADPPQCFIVDSNAASIRLFTGLGFKRLGDVAWSGVGH